MARDVNVIQVAVTPVLDTAAYVAGDSMADIIEIARVIRKAGPCAELLSAHVVDANDQGQAFDIIFFDRSVTLPAKNAVWNVSDADMAFSQGVIRVESGDYVDAGGNRVATKRGLGLGVKPNSTSLYAGLLSQGTGTYTASGLKLVFTFKRDG